MFGDFSQIFHDLPDGPEKTALALKVFGKAGAELIPLLNEGRSGIRAYTDELNRLGGTVTPATAAAADAFNDNLDKLKVAFGGLALKVAEELLPQMIMLTNSMVDFAKNGDNAAGIAGFIGTQFEGTARSIRATSNEMAVLAKLWNTQGLFGDGILKTLSDAQVQFDTDEAKRSNRSRIGMGRGIRGGKGMGASLPKSTAAVGDLYTPDAPAGAKGKKNIDEVAQAYERMNAQMAETIALFGQTTEVAKVRYDLEHGDLAKLDAAKKSELLQQAASIDLLKEEADEKDKLKKLDDDRLESIKQHKKDIKQLLDDIAFETELTKLNNDERERAIALRHANADAASEEGQQIIAALDAL